MKKPELRQFCKMPTSTMTGASYDYEAYSKALDDYISTMELEIMKDIAFSFTLHSDMSARCNGYKSLVLKISECENNFKKK